MRFKGLDLNLLAAFHVLAEELSVSSAARRINLSQPAMSAALRRLRAAFGDELLVQAGNRMILTPHAESLLPRIASILADTEELMHLSNVFDPASSDRHFKVSASDYVTAVVLTPLMADLAERAPGIVLEIMSPTERPADMLERGQIDLLFTPLDFASRDHPSREAFLDRYVVVGWAGNPCFDGGMTLEEFLTCGHVTVQFVHGRVRALAETAMDAMALNRRVEAIAPNFTSVPGMLRGTRRLSVMHERLARSSAQTMPLLISELPFEIPSLVEVMQYHSARSNDPGLRWLMARIDDVIGQV